MELDSGTVFSFLSGIAFTILAGLLLAQYGIRNASKQEIDDVMQDLKEKMK